MGETCQLQLQNTSSKYKIHVLCKKKTNEFKKAE